MEMVLFWIQREALHGKNLIHTPETQCNAEIIYGEIRNKSYFSIKGKTFWVSFGEDIDISKGTHQIRGVHYLQAQFSSDLETRPNCVVPIEKLMLMI